MGSGFRYADREESDGMLKKRFRSPLLEKQNITWGYGGLPKPVSGSGKQPVGHRICAKEVEKEITGEAKKMTDQ